MKGLQPDGSGRVADKDDKNRKFFVTLEPGNGPRTLCGEQYAERAKAAASMESDDGRSLSGIPVRS